MFTIASMSKLVRAPEIAELRAFCAAVDLGSIGKAARLLRVSQPGLSKRLKALEALSGSRLLERSTRGVAPTPAGRELHEAAKRVLAEAEAVEALMAGLGAAPAPVRIAASPTIAECVLPAILVELESRHERHLSVELSTANSRAARELVLEGRAELGVVAEGSGPPRSGLQESPFYEDEIVVVVPGSHRWAQAGEVDPAELERTPMIMRDPGASSRQIVADALEPLGLALAPPLAEIGSTGAAISAAISECAPALLSSLATSLPAGEELAMLRIAGLSLDRRFVLIHSGEESLSAPSRALARHLLAARAEASPALSPRAAQRPGSRGASEP